MEKISIRGARTHNLKNLNVDLPRGRLIVLTGLSGSGKSSLAFDTIYAEGQRRYVESLSAYARQFLSLMEKPDVDTIEGLSPAISIEQKSASHNPRSTVGTVTEIYDYLRLLYARVGRPRCPEHGVSLQAQSVSQMVDQVLALPAGTRLMVLAPLVAGRKGEYRDLLESLRRQGFIRARIDGRVYEIADAPPLKKNIKHTIEVIVDRLGNHPDRKQRLAESMETALRLSDGLAKVARLAADGEAESDGAEGDGEVLFSALFSCPHCGYNLRELEPRLFSFNNPAGACPACDGLGVRRFFDPRRVVSEPGLSLAAGAIPGWDRRNAWYFSAIQSLARHYGFDVDQPFKSLPKKVRHVVLHGSGGEQVTFTYPGFRGRRTRRKHAWEGVIPNRERRYHETESVTVREYLERFMSTKPCDDCGGSRLRLEARNVLVGGLPVHEVTAMPVEQCLQFFRRLELDGQDARIAEKIAAEINQRLQFLANVGLEYLALSRTAETLSGGEAQRIRLASQIGSGLVGVMYVLDEPSIGLHQRDNARLLDTLFRLRDLGNTIIVVEHDEETIRSADHVLDLGPGAGRHGGALVAQGAPRAIEANPASVTGQYLSGRRRIRAPASRRQADPKRMLTLRGARGNNLKSLTVNFPLGLFTCVTGVSGSGKSTLVNDTLFPVVARELYGGKVLPAEHDSVDGLRHLDKIIDINQSPIGRTPRSNPATYTGLFTPVRELFTQTPEARARGYKPGRFSFNVKGGRCEACSGDGLIKVEMHFLPDIYVSCDSCKGARYNRETLEVCYKGKNISQALDMTVEQAAEFFSALPVIKRKLDTLLAVGLGYIHLGQSATTLSGGEAQRIKLARELSKRDTGRTLYVLDEPTTGLHFHDIQQLLNVLHQLRDDGNTVVVIEHNLEVIKTADWIIDLGPEGGHRGGQIITAGPPEEVCHTPASHTGRHLAAHLQRERPAA